MIYKDKTKQKFQIFRQSIITLAPLNQCNIKVKRKGASFGICRKKEHRLKNEVEKIKDVEMKKKMLSINIKGRSFQPARSAKVNAS